MKTFPVVSSTLLKSPSSVSKMLSTANLKTFSRFILLISKSFLIPSHWDSGSCQFKETQTTKKHLRVRRGVLVFDACFRIWCLLAYGYMVYWGLMNPETTVRAVMPIAYLCCMIWCVTIRLVSHAYKTEIEHFLNGFINLNNYLG